MINSEDVIQMVKDMAAIRGDRSEQIVIRRGAGVGLTELAAQTVRIARIVAQGREAESPGAAQHEGRAVILGGANLDIAVGDRFTDAGGRLYQVVYIRPNRSAATMAEAIVVE
jgi:hypothetical protein